jgi:hypothetical protein
MYSTATDQELQRDRAALSCDEAFVVGGSRELPARSPLSDSGALDTIFRSSSAFGADRLKLAHSSGCFVTLR